MPHIKTAEDGSTSADLYREVKAIFRAEGIILTGVKNKSQEGRMVDQGIVDHTFKCIIKGEKREGGVSLAKNL
jgi:hypothetical protein